MKASECAGVGLGEALGLELTDSLNVAAWVSFNGVSAVPYPEATACSLFGKNFEEGFIFSHNKKVFTHSDFVKAANAGVFPCFLLRKPLSKSEKKLLLGSYEMKRSKSCFGSDGYCPSLKADLRGDEIYSKGVENMFYIVNTKRNLFLTKSLSWIDIGSLKKSKKLMSQLFCVKDDITAAQSVVLWVTPPGETTFPCTPSTLKRKYRIVFPNPTSDALKDGIHSRSYPAFLSKKPESRREVVAFQMALRGGPKNLEERTLLSLGKLPATEPESVAVPSVSVQLGNDGCCSPKEEMEILLKSDMTSVSDADGDRSEPFSFQHHASSVAESSALIRSVIEASVAFGKIVSEAPGLVAQKRVDLEMIQRQLLDLDHVAEFYSLNAADGFRMNKTRKEYLQRRRIIKDEIIVLDMVTSCLSKGVTPGSIHAFVNGIMNLDHRCYTTRALTVSEVKDLIRNPETQALILGKMVEPAVGHVNKEEKLA